MRPKSLLQAIAFSTIIALAFSSMQHHFLPTARAEDATVDPDEDAVNRSRKMVKTLDNIFKQTIVLVTDKYVHSVGDSAAGSAAVLLFTNISYSGTTKLSLIYATGDPYESDNVAQYQFEREGVKRLKAGAALHEQVVTQDGKPYLRALTPVPVVMEKCIMCHAHYEDVKQGDPIGAISYTVPIE